ncbi:hypothetical protein BDN72DRAFT_612635 [Pluteus cervinus]|uniref:Uncharacterized protein n=1 Tax=Pluteus cervinus TaxID=181527 RepID=A0ACD3AUG3_9AGAR|nr:hypothetical protein BDN72DRAFT_612635 [Pluteus cervinus]
MPTDLEPIFPPEIEEIIFKLAAQDLKEGGKLILVAKRVYHWLLPDLWKIAIFGSKIPRRPHLRQELFEKLGQYARHLLIWDHDFNLDGAVLCDRYSTCLSWCSNITDLTLWIPRKHYNKSLVDHLPRLRLTHLCFDVVMFHAELVKHSMSTHVSFPFLTHLQLLGLITPRSSEFLKGYFPSLTHLALDGDQVVSPESILDLWKDQLRVLVWMPLDADILLGDPGPSLPDDPRIVVISEIDDMVEDWTGTVTGTGGIWVTAAAVIKSRGGC